VAEVMRTGPDPRSDDALAALRDDDVIRRAQLWATGATIHDVSALIGMYRVAAAALDGMLDGTAKLSQPRHRRYALLTVRGRVWKGARR
jgi:hypothetical protein